MDWRMIQHRHGSISSQPSEWYTDSIPSGLDENSDVGVRPVDVKPFLIEPVLRKGWIWSYCLGRSISNLHCLIWVWFEALIWWWFQLLLRIRLRILVHHDACSYYIGCFKTPPFEQEHHPILVSPGISEKSNTSMNSEWLFKGLVCTFLQDIICGITFSRYFCFLVFLWLDNHWAFWFEDGGNPISKSWLFQPGGNNQRWQVGKQRGKWGCPDFRSDGIGNVRKFLVDSLSLADSR